MKILQASNLTKIYGSGENEVHALDGVNFSVEKGEFVAIVGTSGSGKSTLLHMLGGLDRPTGGSVEVDGKEIFSLKDEELTIFRRRKIGFVFQNYNLVYRLCAIQNVLHGRLGYKNALAGALGLYTEDEKARAFELLDEVGLGEFAYRRADQLSGGQKQRVGIARALVLNPALVICDEPISALDVSIQAQVVNLLRDYQQAEGTSYLFIAHDLSMVRYVSDDIGVMYLGQLVESSDSEEIYKNPLHPYTKGLLSCIPIADPKLARAHASAGVEGDLPSPVNPKPGCRFCGRCPYAKPICSEQTPAMKEAAPGHFVACHLY